MKTKEELKNIKLFADFIGDDLKEWYGYDVDTKQQIVINYFTEFSRFYNPQDDWNLLMKAYEKMRDIPDKYYSKYQHCLDRVQAYMLESDNVIVYDELLFFIKLYNKEDNNTNNNQS